MPGGVVAAHWNTFTHLALDRATEHRDDAAWVRARESAPDTRFLLVDRNLAFPVDAASGELYWVDATTRRTRFALTPASLLGIATDGRAYFMLTVEQAGAESVDATVQWRGLRDIGLHHDAFAAGLCAYARSLAQWQATTRYCCKCGAPLVHAAAGHRGECTNKACGAVHFPRTDPAVIMLVECDGACLLGHQAAWAKGRYSTLAGFVEPGETLEAAVRREVAEEAGITVDECRYHSSQPWPFPASLMLGFMATARNHEISLHDGELADARWFTPRDVVRAVGDGSLVLSSPISVSWRLLADWMRVRADIDLATLRGPAAVPSRPSA